MIASCRAFGAVVLAALVGMAAAQAEDTPGADTPWVTLNALPEPVTDVAGAAVNGRLYVFGGVNGGFKPRGLVFQYDAATDSWTKKKPMPLALHRFALAAYGDKIYLFGGFKYPDSGAAAWQPVDNAWLYDPASDEWKPLAAMPSKRGAAAAAVADGRIYVIGGATVTPGSADAALQAKRRDATVAAVEEYDPKTNSWRARAPLPTPRNHAAAVTVAGKIYVIGGRIGSAFASEASNTDVVEAYDPVHDIWSRPLARMPAPRSAFGAAPWRNRIVIAGGETTGAQGAAAASAVASYDPANDQWSAWPPLPSPRRGAASDVIGDRFYVVGGEPTASTAAGSAAADAKPGDLAATDALQLDVLK